MASLTQWILTQESNQGSPALQVDSLPAELQVVPLRGLHEPRVATREESGVLGFPSRRGLTPQGSLECNPEIPAFPGEEYYWEGLGAGGEGDDRG